MQVRAHCLALGGADLISAAGNMTTAVIAAVAEFEQRRKARNWGVLAASLRSSRKPFAAGENRAVR
jgi:putative DNA-invertase from lambdoid prophage Rac